NRVVDRAWDMPGRIRASTHTLPRRIMTKWEYVTVPLIVHATSRSSISGARTDTNSCRSYRVRTTTDSSPTSSARRNDPPASLLSEDSTYSTHFERGPMSKTLDRIAELGLDLPEIAAPAGAYVPALRTGNYVYTSGQLPVVDGKL